MDFSLAKKIPLAPLCIARLGYKLDKAKSCRNWLVIEKGADKFICGAAPNKTGDYCFQSLTGNETGTIIDLLREVEQMSWAEVRSFLKEENTHIVDCSFSKKNTKKALFER